MAGGQRLRAPGTRLLQQQPGRGGGRGRGHRLTQPGGQHGARTHAGEPNLAGSHRSGDHRNRLVRATPEPSRRGSSGGRSTGTPLAAAARAGVGPAQARARGGPRPRNRWQRTPPVARPLRGVLLEGGDLGGARLGAGRASDGPATVTTTASAAGSTAPKKTTRRPGELDAGHAAGRAALGTHRRGREAEQLGVVVMKTRSSSPVRSSTAPTTTSPSLRPMTSKSSLVGRVVRHDPLDDALLGAQRQPRARPRRAGRAQSLLAGRQVDRPPSGRRPPGTGPRVRWQGRQVDAESRTIRPAVVTSADLAARGRRTAETMTSCLAALAVAGRGLGGRGAREQPGRGQQHPARVVGDLQRRRRRAGAPAARAARYGAGCRAPWRRRPARSETELAQQLLVAEDRAQLLDLARSSVPLGLQLDPGEPVSRRSCSVEDVVGLDLRQVEDAR